MSIRELVNQEAPEAMKDRYPYARTEAQAYNWLRHMQGKAQEIAKATGGYTAIEANEGEAVTYRLDLSASHWEAGTAEARLPWMLVGFDTMTAADDFTERLMKWTRKEHTFDRGIRLTIH